MINYTFERRYKDARIERHKDGTRYMSLLSKTHEAIAVLDGDEETYQKLVTKLSTSSVC